MFAYLDFADFAVWLANFFSTSVAYFFAVDRIKS